MNTDQKEICGPSPLSFLKGLKAPYPFYFHQLMKQYGDVVNCGFNIHLISHPDVARHCFNHDLKNYARRDLVSKRMQAILGNGLLTSEGETWVEHRKIVKPYFSRAGVNAMMPQALETIDRYLDGLSTDAHSGRVVDLTEEFSNLAFLIAAHAFFNTDLSDEVRRIIPLMRSGEQYVISKNPVFIPFWVPTPGHFRIRRINREINELLLTKILPECTAKGALENVGSALCNALSQHPDNPPAQTMISDEIRTLIFASATIGAVLSTCWHLLGAHPEYRTRLYAEAERISIDLSALHDPAEDFPFATQVIMESMRLYSAAFAVWRKCIAEDRVGDFIIPKGASVMTSLFNIHRHPDIWENPDVFDPSRFERDLVRKRPRHYFMPFGWGPHKCVGDHFSMWVAPLTLLRMAQKYRVNVLPNQPLRLRHAIAIIPERVDATLQFK